MSCNNNTNETVQHLHDLRTSGVQGANTDGESITLRSDKDLARLEFEESNRCQSQPGRVRMARLIFRGVS